VNNEILPFKDSVFNSYISNLSLMIVNNHINQIKEAFRVLKNNGIAVFTVWGNPEKCEMFTLFDIVINKHFPGS
jgi:ubiquinone/menaquinone biosynthesis C-methylase UbiE